MQKVEKLELFQPSETSICPSCSIARSTPPAVSLSWRSAPPSSSWGAASPGSCPVSGKKKPCLFPLHCLLVVVYLLSHLFATLWTAALQASLSFTISQSLLKLTSIESMMPSNHLILCNSLLHLPSILPSIRVFSNESALQNW